MGALLEMAAADRAEAKCSRCFLPQKLCECGPDIKENEETSAETTSSGTTTVQGTGSFDLAAGHTCDFEYFLNLAQKGIPFKFDDMENYIALLNRTSPEKIEPVLSIGKLAYAILQQGNPHEAALLRGLVAISGHDLDPEDTARKLKLNPELKNDPDATFKAALNYGAPTPAFKPAFSS